MQAKSRLRERKRRRKGERREGAGHPAVSFKAVLSMM
jgi:hypothetical protein